MSRTRNTQDVPAETDTSVNTDETTESTVPAETGTKVDVSTLSVSDPDKVREAYQNADRAGKAAIRTFVTKAMMSAIDASDLDAAIAAKALNATLVTEREASAKTVDYVQIVAERAYALKLAQEWLITTGPDNLPEGVELDIAAVADKYRELLESNESAESYEPAKALISVKFGTKAAKRDVGAHLREWAESVESGTFATIAQVAAFRSNEYGTDNPSNGAVAAHLFGNGETAHDGSKYDKSDSTLVVPVAASATNVRGVRKV